MINSTTCVFLGVLIALYLVLLFLLNKIPNVRIKKFGWLSIYNVTTELGDHKVYVRKIGVRFNFFKEKGSPFRFFHLEFTGVDVLLNASASGGAPHSSTKSGDKSVEGIPELVFPLPKKLLEKFFIDKIANQFTVHFYKFSIRVDGTPQKYVGDYLRVENTFDKQGSNKFIISLYNGFLQLARTQDDGSTSDEQIKLYRNIELTITCDIILSCKKEDLNKYYVSLMNFNIYLSIGRLTIPVNEMQLRSKVTSATNSVDTNSPNAVNSDTPDAASCDDVGPSRNKLVGGVQILQKVLDLLDTVELKFEDIRATYNDLEIKVANVSTSLACKERVALTNSDFFNFLVFLVSTRVYHKNSRIVDLPSFSNSLDIDARRVLTAINLIRENPDTCTKAQHLDLKIDNKCLVTNPKIDIYYDHAELIEFSVASKKHSKSEREALFKARNHHLWKILHFFSEVTTKLTLIDLDVNIHIPPKGSLTFSRNSQLNNVLTFHLSSFIHKSTSRNFKTSKTSHDRSIVISQVFKFKNFRMNAIDNTIIVNMLNLMTCYNVVEENASVRLYVKKLDIKSINATIFHLIREIRNWSNSKYNDKYRELQESFKNGSGLCPLGNESVTSIKEIEEDQNALYLDLFENIPLCISSVKVHVSSIEADITCKDGLPSLIITDNLGNKVDMADFSRGISVKLLNTEFSVKVPKRDISASVRSVQCFTLSEYDAEYSTEHDMGLYDYQSDLDFNDIESFDSNVFKGIINPDSDSMKAKAKKVLQIHNISIANSDITDTNKLLLKIPEIDGRITMFLVWCSIYATLLGKYFSPTVKKICTLKEMENATGLIHKKLNIDLQIDLAAFVVRLPNSVDVLLELDMMKITNSLATKTRSIKFNNARGFVVHPSTKLWTNLLVVKKSIVSIGSETSCTLVDTEGIKLIIPSQFLFYTVIDNFITFFKAVKQVKYNFLNMVNGKAEFDVIYPDEKPALVFPKVRVKSKGLFLALENDAFESELSYILELGKLIQPERLKCMEAFDKQCEILKLESIENKIQLSENSGYTSSLLGTGTQESSLPVLSDDEINEKIQIARDEFNIGLSTGWIHKFKAFRTAKIRKRLAKVNKNWQEDPISETILNKFEIMNNSSAVPLFTGIFLDLDLEFDRVAPDIQDNLDDFIFKKAKGQPKQHYSILVPLHLSLKCNGLYAYLKDYPLPVLSFPPHSDSEHDGTVNLRGNIVINETLFRRPEELRHIFVPCSPISFDSEVPDMFYSVNIPRTLTPVKFVVDIECDLDTDKACFLTWCKSYQPALGAAMSGFDNFTKPEIDDSPLGSWDKIALLVHGDMNFRVANELCLHIKGGSDPYDTVGSASGLVFSWKNNVHLKIDGSGDLDQILVLESDDFLLAIPNYSILEGSTWSMRRDNLMLGGGTGAEIDFENAEAKKYQKRIMKLTSESRVKWKVGLLFERNKDVNNKQLGSDQERTLKFKPHYEVEVTGPQYAYHPDSYVGFRLDYLHFAISVELKSTSTTNINSHNALCFTPLTFSYFFHWWDIMTNHVTLPARNGKLFGSTGKDKSHVQMGTHLWTIKYQLILEPLTISHFYMHSSNDNLVKNSKIAFTGLKGRFKSCVIDLHQRKETVRYVNEKLNINNQVLHLKMNKGEIIIDDADIRVVRATFADKLIRGHLASQMSTGLSNTSIDGLLILDSLLNSPLFGQLLHQYNLFSSDGWVDADDFVELEQRDLLSSNPKIQILPFFHSPSLSYVREFSFLKGGKYPFGNEASHVCALGYSRPEITQMKLMEERILNIEQAISENETLITKSIDPQRSRKLHSEQKILRDKLDVVKALHQQLGIEAEDFIEEAVDGYHVHSNGDDVDSLDSEDSSHLAVDSRKHSMAKFGSELSVYASHRTEDEMIKTGILNKNASEYHNRFIIHNMKLQWHNKLRDLFVDYIQRVSDRRSEVYFLSQQALGLVEKVIKELKAAKYADSENDEEEEELEMKKSRSNIPDSSSCTNSEEIISRFEDEISKRGSDQDAEKNFLFKLIHPQIQLNSNKDRSSCVLISARDIEMRLLDINKQGMSDIISESAAVSGLIENRYGLLFKDLHVFVFKKDSNQNQSSVLDLYGGAYDSSSYTHDEKVWPPWVDFETCYENTWLKNELVVERNSLALIYSKQNPLYAASVGNIVDVKNDETGDKTDSTKLKKPVAMADSLSIYLAKIVISATAEQYGAVNTAIIDLVLKLKTKRDQTLEKLEKIMSLTDSSDLEGFDKRVSSLQKNIKFFRKIFLQLELRGIKLSKDCEKQLIFVEIELERMKLELFVLLKGLRHKSLKNGKKISQIMSIFANQIILHLLKEDREPFIDFAIAKLRFVQSNSIDRTTSSIMEVNMVQAFNLQSNAIYPELLRPLHDYNESTSNGKPLIKLTWKLLEPVGGIAILERAKFELEPLKIEVDYETITTLISYVFPKGVMIWRVNLIVTATWKNSMILHC